MKTKHTPGPWTVCEKDNDERLSIEAESPQFICFVDPCIQRDANANLIAAAPDLFDALAECIDALEFIENRTSTQYNPPTLDNARAALAKAKGER